jgi:hypothetical protein
LREGISRPAALFGRSFEPEAVDRLINEVRGRPGDLPLLGFALSELWSKDAQTGVLTLRSYEALGFVGSREVVGGARGVIIKRAEEIWEGYSKSGRAAPFKRVFLALVLAADPEGADGKIVLDASRRARLSEFSAEARAVAESLASSFLLTASRDQFSGEPAIEVAHEALIRNWPRLRQWVEDTRPFLAWFTNDLAPYLQRWLDENKIDDLLLPGQCWRRQKFGPYAHPISSRGRRPNSSERAVSPIVGCVTFAWELQRACWVF